MVDYDKASGEGTIRIRDLQDSTDNVEFWVKAGYTNFWWDGLEFSSYANGATQNYSIDYPSGALWKRVAVRTIRETQSVTFKLLTATGTSSLGGPTTLTATINRDTKPPAPDAPQFLNLDNNSVEAWFTNNGNGGDSLTNWAIGISTGSTIPSVSHYPGSDQRMVISGLNPGTTYYFWSRVANSLGWSDWSARSSIKTHDVPAAPSKPVLSALAHIAHNSITATFSDGANNGGSIDSRQLAYSTSNSVSGATIIASDGSTVITGLAVNTTYYIWARTHNVYGYSGWSLVASAKTANVPDAADMPTISQVEQTSMHVVFTANGNGGSPITGYEIGYGTSSTTPQTIVTSDMSTTLTGLLPGRQYYVWARAVNAAGPGPWSPVRGQLLIAGATVMDGTVRRRAVPWVNDGGVWKVARPWGKVLGSWRKSAT